MSRWLSIRNGAIKGSRFVLSFLLPAAIQIGGLTLLLERVGKWWAAAFLLALVFMMAGVGRIPRWANIGLWLASATGYALWMVG